MPEYRRTTKGNFRHRLGDIIILAILARLCKCVERADIIAFGEQHLKRFQSMGLLEKGVPSEPTLCRVSQNVDDAKMAERFQDFAGHFRKEFSDNGPEIICVDGKAMRGTTQDNGRSPDIVSAYLPEHRITLATEPCEEKSNEIRANPKVLEKVELRGCVVTADAMSMQKDMVDTIRSKGGDFLIELKANQRSLFYATEDWIRGMDPVDTHTHGPELAHGRIETRTCNIYNGEGMAADKGKWGGELTIVQVVSHTEDKKTGRAIDDARLYATSLAGSAAELGRLARRHWAIESMHWELDRNLLQDRLKRKSRTSARNLDTIQRTVLSLFGIWKGRRRKRADKELGTAELARRMSRSFTKMMRFLCQK